MTEKITVIQKFKKPMRMQPNFMIPSNDQKTILIASRNDGIYISLNDNEDIDLDEMYGIDSIQ